jgi:hypothetical protein
LNLAEQIEKEKQELKNVKYVPVAQLGPDKNTRCHFCGQLSTELDLVEVINGFERYRGRACCGGYTNE